MKRNNIRFAFAVSSQNKFLKKHFGDADKYLIYEWNQDELIEISEKINSFKNYDELQEHGSKKKGEAIIDMLCQADVNAIVSMQFGKNISLINKNFVPIIIKTSEISEVKEVLTKHIKWIDDELKQNNLGYKLFSINNGALKIKIENNI